MTVHRQISSGGFLPLSIWTSECRQVTVSLLHSARSRCRYAVVRISDAGSRPFLPGLWLAEPTPQTILPANMATVGVLNARAPN